MIDACQLCRKAAELTYAVDSSKPKRLCSECAGKWDAKPLADLLGIVPDHLKSDRAFYDLPRGTKPTPDDISWKAHYDSVH